MGNWKNAGGSAVRNKHYTNGLKSINAIRCLAGHNVMDPNVVYKHPRFDVRVPEGFPKLEVFPRILGKIRKTLQTHEDNGTSDLKLLNLLSVFESFEKSLAQDMAWIQVKEPEESLPAVFRLSGQPGAQAPLFASEVWKSYVEHFRKETASKRCTAPFGGVNMMEAQTHLLQANNEMLHLLLEGGVTGSGAQSAGDNTLGQPVLLNLIKEAVSSAVCESRHGAPLSSASAQQPLPVAVGHKRTSPCSSLPVGVPTNSHQVKRPKKASPCTLQEIGCWWMGSSDSIGWWERLNLSDPTCNADACITKNWSAYDKQVYKRNQRVWKVACRRAGLWEEEVAVGHGGHCEAEFSSDDDTRILNAPGGQSMYDGSSEHQQLVRSALENLENDRIEAKQTLQIWNKFYRESIRKKH